MASFGTLYICLLVFFIPIQSLAQTNGIIPLSTSLTATKNSTPWLSPLNDFAFGFQFIQQKNLFLLSMWYHKLRQKTVVWYPPQGKLVPSGSKVELNAQFGLVLTDPQGKLVWTTSLNNAATTIDRGFINDTGNFVLMGPDSSSLWESFEDPRDTLLPTQKMERKGVLNSRISSSNFSKGRFQFRMLEDGNAVLNTRNQENGDAYDAYYWSHTFGGTNSSNSGLRVVFENTGHLFVVRESGERLDLTALMAYQTGGYYYRATLDYNGVFVVYSHPKGEYTEQDWTTLWFKPEDICSAGRPNENGVIANELGSGACGYNSICELNNDGRPKCECPQGFSLLDPNYAYAGCKPDFMESCDGKGQNVGANLYVMEDLPNTDWPSNAYEFLSTSVEGCRNSCLNDCFCVVAINNNGNECWKKRLPLSNGVRSSSKDTKAFLKIKKGDLLIKGKQGTSIPLVSKFLVTSIVINFVILGVAGFGLFHIYKRKIAKPILGNNVPETNLRSFNYEELFEATNGFNQELGRGAFGIVYKGIIEMGDTKGEVAIKKLDRVVEESEKEFRAEVNVIGHTHHKNLVRLIGFCNQGEHRLLVYEYMRNGTVSSFLFSPTKPSWNLRSQIALGIARGLLYLHEECTTQIIHCDIKPQNILIDDHYNVRISDFGLAKLLMIDQSHTNTAIRGTRGYVAPEWFRNSPVTVKVDVYSFGVILLEIVTCRKSIDVLNGGGGGGEREILVDWVWDCFQQGRLEDLVENYFEALSDMNIVKRFVLVGIWCIQEDPNIRPNMTSVIQMLEGVVEVALPPSPWPFSSVVMEPGM